MNGTSGMRPKMAHATFAPAPMSDRVARSIHMSTTATGWKRQTISSRSFFTPPESTRRPRGYSSEGDRGVHPEHFQPLGSGVPPAVPQRAREREAVAGPDDVPLDLVEPELHLAAQDVHELLAVVVVGALGPAAGLHQVHVRLEQLGADG